MEYLKDVFKKILGKIKGPERKKLAENCIIMVIIGVVLILVAGPLLGGKKDNGAGSEKRILEHDDSDVYESGNPDFLEKKVEALLSSIMGAGKTEVMITYYSGTEKITAYDLKKKSSETDETDSEGGRRTISQSEYESTVIYEDSVSGNRQAVVLKEVYPEVKGVVVVADGAGDIVVREKLTRAVAVLLDIPIHKVRVFERRKK